MHTTCMAYPCGCEPGWALERNPDPYKGSESPLGAVFNGTAMRIRDRVLMFFNGSESSSWEIKKKKNHSEIVGGAQ